MWIRHALSLCLVVAFGWAAIFWYAPLYTYDHIIGLQLFEEIRQAFWKYGIWDFDFTPLRCLGIPSFSNPTSLQWSLYHPFALLLPGLYPAYGVYLVLGVLSYIFAYEFFRACRLDNKWASLLALGWALQGFLVARTLASHTNYNVFGLVPLFFLMYLKPARSWFYLFACAFVIAHTFYTSSIYFPLMLMSGSVLVLILLKWVDSAGLVPLTQVTWKTFFLRSFAVFGLAGLMSFAKVLGVLNYSAIFPRIMPLLEIDFWMALISSASHQFYPLPWNHYELTRWWYRNWEAYIWLFPGLIYFLLWKFAPHWRERAVWKWFGAFVLIIFVGGVTNSGILKPIVSALPIVRSFHVNPRWTATTVILLMPLLVWAILYLKWQLRRGQEIVLWVLFAGLPFYFIDDQDMAIEYPVESYVNTEVGRALMCYEPNFGYGLEMFPKAKSFNLLSFDMVDPRCYLASNRCEPGTSFKDVENGSELNRQLKSYELRDEYPPVKYGKIPSLFLYFLGFFALIGLAWSAVRRSPTE